LAARTFGGITDAFDATWNGNGATDEAKSAQGDSGARSPSERDDALAASLHEAPR
jgi:hypothetical protein